MHDAVALSWGMHAPKPDSAKVLPSSDKIQSS